MAPNTHEANPVKCKRYARFLSGISHQEANGIFWGCFALVIFLLVVVGIFYASSARRHKTFQLAEHVATWHPSSSPEQNTSKIRHLHKHSEKRLFWGSLVCSLAMIPIVIMIAFAGLAVNFCHHEDLIMFFWGPFFLLSVGSLIATWGLFLSQSIENEPAWNVALGTPVLVFAALGHWAHVLMRWGWMKMRGKKEVDAVTLAPSGTVPRYLAYCADCNRHPDSLPSLIYSSSQDESQTTLRPAKTITVYDANRSPEHHLSRETAQVPRDQPRLKEAIDSNLPGI